MEVLVDWVWCSRCLLWQMHRFSRYLFVGAALAQLENMHALDGEQVSALLEVLSITARVF